jgi:hypothetical protein
MGCDSTEHRGAGIHVLYSDGSLKWLAVSMVSAEMLNCKLLSTQAAGIQHLNLHDVMEYHLL